jgi:uncharacterized DUF497 family protein
VLYEWDPAKAAANLEKHGVSFANASTVFLDPLAATWPDPDHSASERRFITLGLSTEAQLLFVAHQEIAEDRIRIISARRATRRERHGYQEGL